MALVKPRLAVAVGADRRHAGRSGSDVLLLLAIVLAATQLRWIVGAAWIGAAVDAGLGLRAAFVVLTRTFTVDLGFLVIAALVIWAASGPRRELGRSFDLACVAAVPMIVVDLVRLAAVHVLGAAIPALMWALAIGGYAWMGAVIVIAIVSPKRQARPADLLEARRVGWGIASLAVAALAVEVGWLATHADMIRPLEAGAPAPALNLATIGPNGALGPRITLPAGKIVVVDFWATWCGPCLTALPHLDALARKHPDIAVIAVDLDDFAAARSLFDTRGYSALTLVADDGHVSEQYGVDLIPHTAVIDRQGKVRRVGRGGGMDLEAEIAKIR